MAPRALGLGAGQITFVVVTAIASTLGDSAITSFFVAFTLLQIPIGIIGVPLGVVVLPSLSREAALGRIDEFAALVSRAIRLLLFVMLPITGIAIVLRHEIVDLLFESRRFGEAASDLTAATLFTFLIGLAAHALIAVLARAFYARQDTKTPVAAAILAVVVNSTLAGVLAGPLGLPGLGLAIAIAAWLETIVLFVLLRRSLPELAFRPILVLAAQSMVVAVGGTLAAAGVAARVQRVGSLLTLFFTGSPVACEADTRAIDRERFARFHRGMRERGVLLPPSQMECWFLSLAHTDADIDTIGDAAADTLKEMAEMRT
jgi:murein biosynthesis integral membrane protein MurJ